MNTENDQVTDTISNTEDKGSAQEPATAGNAATGGSVQQKLKILIGKIRTSPWNRRHNLPSDEAAVSSLAEDIKANGLLSPLSLVKAADGDEYHVLAGARRLEALRLLRGDEGELAPSEYVLQTGLMETDIKCLDFAVGEGRLHGDLSPIATAKYVNRLREELNVDQTTLADRLKMPRLTVNRLNMLSKRFEELPEGWRDNLSISPDQARKAKPAIKFAHWNEIAGKFQEGTLSEGLLTVLEEAHVERYTISQFRSRIATGLGGISEKIESQRIAVLAESVRVLRKAAEILKASNPDLAATVNRDADTKDAELASAKQAEATKQADAKEKRKADAAEKKAAKAVAKAEAKARKHKEMAEKAAVKAAESQKAADAAQNGEATVQPVEEVASIAA